MPYALGTVELACADAATTMATINFADFGTPNVKGGCTKYASNASCSEKHLRRRLEPSLHR